MQFEKNHYRSIFYNLLRSAEKWQFPTYFYSKCTLILRWSLKRTIWLIFLKIRKYARVGVYYILLKIKEFCIVVFTQNSVYNAYKRFMLVWKYHTLQKFCKACINYLIISIITYILVIVHQYVEHKNQLILPYIHGKWIFFFKVREGWIVNKFTHQIYHNIFKSDIFGKL